MTESNPRIQLGKLFRRIVHRSLVSAGLRKSSHRPRSEVTNDDFRRLTRSFELALWPAGDGQSTVKHSKSFLAQRPTAGQLRRAIIPPGSIICCISDTIPSRTNPVTSMALSQIA